MAKNRSRRLRKKMHIDEFQELGFSVHLPISCMQIRPSQAR